MNKKGFTLVELLITMAVIGVLAAGAVTAYIGVTKKAARSEAFAALESLLLLQERSVTIEHLVQPLVKAGHIQSPGFCGISITRGFPWLR